jgi:hypothetical protein
MKQIEATIIRDRGEVLPHNHLLKRFDAVVRDLLEISDDEKKLLNTNNTDGPGMHAFEPLPFRLGDNKQPVFAWPFKHCSPDDPETVYSFGFKIMAAQPDGTEPTPFGFEPESVLVHTYTHGHLNREVAHAKLDRMLRVFEPPTLRERVGAAVGFLVGGFLPHPGRQTR